MPNIVYAWTNEFLVSTTPPFSAGNQLQPVVTALDGSTFTVAWTDARPSSTSVIALRAFDEFAIEDDFGSLLANGGAADNFSAAVARLSNGNFVKVSIAGDDGTNGSNPNATGNLLITILDPDLNVVASTSLGNSGLNNFVSVGGLEGGGFALTITTAFAGNQDVYTYTYDASGTPLNPLGTLVHTASTQNQTLSEIVPLPGGNYLVTWVDGGAVGLLDNELMARQFTASGLPVGAAYQIDQGGGATEQNDAAVLTNGNVVFVTTLTNSTTESFDGSETVGFRIMNPSGAPVTAQIVVPGPIGATSITSPSVIASADGGFVIAFQANFAAAESEIFLVFYDENGTLTLDQLVGPANTTPGATDPDMALLDDGRIVLVWTDPSPDPDHPGGTAIRGKVYDPRDGIVAGTSENDVLVGTPISDQISGFDGNDRLEGMDGSDQLFGGAGVDILRGGAGADTLDGGGGVDQMYGGADNDVYYVDVYTDAVYEGTGEGTFDQVYASVSYALTPGAQVERLATTSQTGTAAITLIGNEFGQQMLGNNGNNTLAGGGGIDSFIGYGGNDIYVVDHASETITEIAGQGTDAVYTTVSYTLAAGLSIERLVAAPLASTNVVNLTGNELAQVIVGNNGVNTINGGAGNDSIYGMGGNDYIEGAQGNDSLFGGTGVDRFVFRESLGAASGIDRIYDMTASDNIVIDALAVSSLTSLTANQFRLGTAAGDADDRIIYDATSGVFWFDPDGTGAQAAILFGVINGAPAGVDHTWFELM